MSCHCNPVTKRVNVINIYKISVRNRDMMISLWHQQDHYWNAVFSVNPSERVLKNWKASEKSNKNDYRSGKLTLL